MIKLNETYSIEKDTHGWQLHEAREGKDKNGAAKMQRKTTYHGTMAQAITFMIDRKCGDCETANELRELLMNAQQECIGLVVASMDKYAENKHE